MWPAFTFPFPPDAKALRKAAKVSKKSADKRPYRSGEWAEQCMKDLELFLTINHSNEFTSEHFKTWCMRTLQRKAPHHGSVWGAVWMAAFKQGKIEKVGVQMVEVTTYKGRYKKESNVWKRRYK